MQLIQALQRWQQVRRRLKASPLGGVTLLNGEIDEMIRPKSRSPAWTADRRRKAVAAARR